MNKAYWWSGATICAAIVGGTMLTATWAQDESEPAATQPVAAQPAEIKLETLEQRASYSIGLNIGANLSQQGLDIDGKALAAGIDDALNKKAPRLTEQQMQQTMMELQQKLMARQMQAAQENVAAGQKFLEENKQAEGVTTTESGLQYKEITAGEGPKPTRDDVVRVHYRGTLPDGTEFDSSYKRGEPATFPVGGVIPGWTEALLMMNVGDKWQIAVPSNLAYGEQGAGGGAIGPNQVLLFDVELLDIVKKGEAK